MYIILIAMQIILIFFFLECMQIMNVISNMFKENKIV